MTTRCAKDDLHFVGTGPRRPDHPLIWTRTQRSGLPASFTNFLTVTPLTNSKVQRSRIDDPEVKWQYRRTELGLEHCEPNRAAAIRQFSTTRFRRSLATRMLLSGRVPEFGVRTNPIRQIVFTLDATGHQRAQEMRCRRPAPNVSPRSQRPRLLVNR